MWHAQGRAEGSLAGLLDAASQRLRPPIVGRILTRTAAGLVRMQIFDRAMTLAAQAFTSIFPLILMLSVAVGRSRGAWLATVANLPPTTRSILDEALDQVGISAFGVLGALIVVLSSTGLARALARG